MSDDSEVEGNLLWRKLFGSKRKPKYWYAHAVLLPLFMLLVVAGILSVVIEGYEMRLQDWGWFVFYWLALVSLIVDLWWQRRKRRKSQPMTSDSPSGT